LQSFEDPAERARLGTDLLGGAWADIAPIVGMGTEAMREAQLQAHELGAVMGDDALNAANDFRKAQEQLKATMTGVFNKIGAELAPVIMEKLVPAIENHVIPAISTFSEKISALIKWFSNLDPKWQKVIGLAALFLVGLGPLLVIIGKVISVVGVITSMLPVLGAVLAAIVSPVGLVVIAVVALIAIWVKFGDDLKRVVNDAFNRVRDTFNNMRNAVTSTVQGLVSGVTSFFSNMVASIGNIVSGVTSVITAPFRAARDQISNITSSIKDAMSNLNPFQRHSPSLVDNVKKGVAVIADEFKSLNSLNFASPTINMGGGSVAAGSSQQMPNVLNFEGMFAGANFNVRSDNDIREIAKELHYLQKQASRGMGVI
jgi:phage-related protein